MIVLKIAGGIVAVVIALFVVAFVRLIWYSVPYEEWVQYERERQRRKRKKTCGTCKQKPRCDRLFEKRYERFGLKEPEALKTKACKKYQEKED